MIKNTLYFCHPAYLSLRNKQMVIKIPDVKAEDGSMLIGEETTRPIEDIGIVMLDHSQITITHGLMEALLENNCAFITCDKRSMPTGMMLSLASHTLQSERFRQQIEASLPLKKQLWQQTIQAKIRNQASTLRQCKGEPAKCMTKWANDVKSGDTNNLEARAAVFYWSTLFDNISGFTRDREGIPPNNLLNYGYAILRAIIARALVERGLLPIFGIHHRNRYNSYCLADDIMEPYRPYVDELVFQMVRQHVIYPELSKDQKIQLLSIATKEVTIEGKRTPLMVAATETATSLWRCYQGESRKISYPEK
jgi:CRISPR-associated protein Cas1